MGKSLSETLELNKKQKEYYSSNDDERTNIFIKIWFYLRNTTLDQYRQKYDLKDRVYEQHKIWLGDLSDKKVLDLGCLRGNALSIYMAKNAKQYIGIDLSDTAIEKLNRKLQKHQCKNAVGIAIDFLSPEFMENNFDIIYAYGVLHHFENFDLLISRLKHKLAVNGRIISHDPLETSFPIKMIRTLYRPFQADKEWEWPFTKKTLATLADNFDVLDQKGILGESKYGIFYQFIPMGKKRKDKLIKKRIDKDWNLRALKDAYPCMQLSLCMQKK